VEEMPSGTKTAKSMRQGGPMICKTLKHVVEHGGPSLGYRALGVVFKVMGAVATPARCRTERWAPGASESGVL